MALFIWMFSIRGVSFLVTIPVGVTYVTDEGTVALGTPAESVMTVVQADGLNMLAFQLFGRPKNLEMVVDLTGFPPDSPGVMNRIVCDGSLIRSIPLSVNPVEFNPPALDIALDRMHYRVLPVSVVSEPAPSRYMSVSLRQSHVRVMGPASVLNSMDSVFTEPVSSTVRMEQQTALALPEGVESEDAAVTARLRNPVPVVPGNRRAY